MAWDGQGAKLLGRRASTSYHDPRETASFKPHSLDMPVSCPEIAGLDGALDGAVWCALCKKTEKNANCAIRKLYCRSRWILALIFAAWLLRSQGLTLTSRHLSSEMVLV